MMTMLLFWNSMVIFMVFKDYKDINFLHLIQKSHSVGGLFIDIERVKKITVPFGPSACRLVISPLFQIAVFNEQFQCGEHIISFLKDFVSAQVV